MKRSKVSSTTSVEIYRQIPGTEGDSKIRISFSNHTKLPEKATISGAPRRWIDSPLESVYIPVKEMLSNAPGFRSLYNLRNIHFEEVYADIIDRAFLDTLKGPTDKTRKKLLSILQKAMEGKVTKDKEEFFCAINRESWNLLS